MNIRKVAIAVTIVLVAVGAAWALGYIGGTDPVVAEMQQLRDQMFDNRDLPEDKRRTQWQNFRKRMDGLTDAQRDALRDGGRERWDNSVSNGWTSFSNCRPTNNNSGSTK